MYCKSCKKNIDEYYGYDFIKDEPIFHYYTYGNYCKKCDNKFEELAKIEAKKQSPETKRIIKLLTLYHRLPDKKIII